MQKKNFQTILAIMFYQIFRSPQVKRTMIIGNKHGIYELPHELPNELRIVKLGKSRIVSKIHGSIT